MQARDLEMRQILVKLRGLMLLVKIFYKEKISQSQIGIKKLPDFFCIAKVIDLKLETVRLVLKSCLLCRCWVHFCLGRLTKFRLQLAIHPPSQPASQQEVVSVRAFILAPQRAFGSLGEDRKSRGLVGCCLLYTSPSPRDRQKSRMPSSA